MKKLAIAIILTALLIPCAAFAGGVIHNSNQSPEYIGTFTRNAAFDAADIAHYNPAGIAWMPNGLYISIGNQFVAKKYAHTTADGTKYGDSEPALVLPNLYAIYKQDKWAVFGSIMVPAGGGSIVYNDGVYHPMVSPSLAEGFTAHIEGAVGGMFKINNMFSVAVLGRVVKGIGDVNSELNGAVVKKYDAEAMGFGATISANARPIPKLNIALRLESPVKLTWKNTNAEGMLAGTVPEERREDLPPIIGFGVSYTICPKMRAEFNANIYLNKVATRWEKVDDTIHGNDPDFQKKFKTGWEVAGSFEYKVRPELKVTIGGMYTVSGSDKHTHDYLRPPIDVFSIGMGATYTVKEKLNVTAGLSKSFYFDDKIESDNGNVVLDASKDSIVFALGLQYKF